MLLQLLFKPCLLRVLMAVNRGAIAQDHPAGFFVNLIGKQNLYHGKKVPARSGHGIGKALAPGADTAFVPTPRGDADAQGFAVRQFQPGYAPEGGGREVHFQGNNQINGGAGNAFGAGLRCAGSLAIRLEVVTPDASGDAATSISMER